eukprot:152910_1
MKQSELKNANVVPNGRRAYSSKLLVSNHHTEIVNHDWKYNKRCRHYPDCNRGDSCWYQHIEYRSESQQWRLHHDEDTALSPICSGCLGLCQECHDKTIDEAMKKLPPSARVSLFEISRHDIESIDYYLVGFGRLINNDSVTDICIIQLLKSLLNKLRNIRHKIIKQHTKVDDKNHRFMNHETKQILLESFRKEKEKIHQQIAVNNKIRFSIEYVWLGAIVEALLNDKQQKRFAEDVIATAKILQKEMETMCQNNKCVLEFESSLDIRKLHAILLINHHQTIDIRSYDTLIVSCMQILRRLRYMDICKALQSLLITLKRKRRELIARVNQYTKPNKDTRKQLKMVDYKNTIAKHWESQTESTTSEAFLFFFISQLHDFEQKALFQFIQPDVRTIFDSLNVTLVTLGQVFVECRAFGKIEKCTALRDGLMKCEQIIRSRLDILLEHFYFKNRKEWMANTFSDTFVQILIQKMSNEDEYAGLLGWLNALCNQDCALGFSESERAVFGKVRIKSLKTNVSKRNINIALDNLLSEMSYANVKHCEWLYCANTKKGQRMKNSKWYKCAKCMIIYYCSKHCQKLDWNKGHHKQICVRVRGK